MITKKVELYIHVCPYTKKISVDSMNMASHGYAVIGTRVINVEVPEYSFEEAKIAALKAEIEGLSAQATKTVTDAEKRISEIEKKIKELEDD